jgi:hypothetical protein
MAQGTPCARFVRAKKAVNERTPRGTGQGKCLSEADVTDDLWFGAGDGCFRPEADMLPHNAKVP